MGENNKTSNDLKTDDFKSWKKPELQTWLRIHRLKVTGTKEEFVVRVKNEKRAALNPNSICTSAGSRVQVPRGSSVLLCTVT